MLGCDLPCLPVVPGDGCKVPPDGAVRPPRLRKRGKVCGHSLRHSRHRLKIARPAPFFELPPVAVIGPDSVGGLGARPV